MTQEQILIQNNFEFTHQDNSRIHYTKDLGGDGFTYLYEDDGSQYDQITKEPVEENETLQQFLNRI